MKVIILGAGRQGTAAAYALLSDRHSVTLVDNDYNRLCKAKDLLEFKFPWEISLLTIQDNPQSIEDFTSLIDGHACCISALPYYLNFKVAKACLAAKVNMCDLGCDPKTLKEQLALNKEAVDAGILIVPDCGLAPGSTNMAAKFVLKLAEENGFTTVDSLKIYCGGLPEYGKSLLNYKILFSPEGLLNNYLAPSFGRTNGEICEFEPFSGYEKFDHMFGEQLEAFRTSGGSSDLPWTLNIKELEYKTLRFVGHRDAMLTLYKIGALDKDRISDTSRALMKEWNKPNLRDFVTMRAVAKCGDKSFTYQMDCDSDLDFSSMEKTTGFAAAISSELMAESSERGVMTPQWVMNHERYFRMLNRFGIKTQLKIS